MSEPFASRPPVKGPTSTAEADLSRLFNLSLDLLCIAGLDGYFQRVNPSWTRVLGWSEAELLSRPVADFMHPDDRERTLQARAALARGTPVRGLENRYLCKDGSYRWLSWQSVADLEAGTVFGVARDTTERRELDAERLVTSKLESAGILAGGLAHDFNNLLTTLTLNLGMIPICGATNTAQSEHLQQALQTIDTAKGLTDQLIRLASRSVPRRERCDLRRIIPALVNFTLSNSGLNHECHLPPDLWLVEVDEAQIARVLRGVLMNAREATPAGGTVRVELENVSTSGGPGAAANAWVRIRISDTGSGIPADVLPKVFDPYFSTKKRGAQKGMGLGLTTCRVVIHEHGGTITVESRAQSGTTVTCQLPAYSDA